MKNQFLPALLIVLLFSCQSEEPAVDYLSLSESQQREAQYALASMEVADGLEVELFASEPMMVNPTNITVDTKGRVWVCEALNYRHFANPDNTPREEGDRILILEDTDGDGKADEQKVFYQGNDVNSAMGIAVFGEKVIVSCSPNVLVFYDRNGDDLPDEKEVLFSGIEGVDHDHGVHAFTFGPDGRYYFNFGNDSKRLQDKNGDYVLDPMGYPVVEASLQKELSPQYNKRPRPYRQGMIFRCEPDGSGVEVLANNFRNNVEVAVDAFGTLWQSDNDDDGNQATRINFVMEYGNYGYHDEMTGAGWRERRVGMHEEIPKRHWHLNDPGVVPNLLQTGAGSPTGMCIYEGDLLPEIFHNQMIHSEALHNVVRAYPVEKDGAGYKARIVNILKSKDQWSRPSDVCVAPDGFALYRRLVRSWGRGP